MREHLPFARWTIDEGLSQNSVNAIVQDARGCIWIGTQDGLNRFDGLNFRIFRHDLDNAESLSSNYVNCMLIDAEARLWVGCKNGLNRYDSARESFDFCELHGRQEYEGQDKDIQTLCEYPAGILWIGSRAGLTRLDLDSGRSHLFRQSATKNGSLRHNRINALYPAGKGRLLLGTELGLFLFDSASENFRSLDYIPEDRRTNIDETWVSCFCRRDAESVWMGTHYSLYCIELPELHVRRSPLELTPPAYKLSRAMTALVQDREARLWIASSDGLHCYDESSGRLDSYLHDPDNPASVAHKIVMGLCYDAAGSLWLATRAGLNMLNRSARKFDRLRHLPGKARSLSDDYITDLKEDAAGNIWVATKDGVNLFDRTRRQFRLCGASGRGEPALSDQYVVCLAPDIDGGIWIGTLGGLNRYDPSSGDIEYYVAEKEGLLDPRYPSSRAIASLMVTADGTLFVGTSGNGFNVYDRARRRFSLIRSGGPGDDGLSDNVVYAMCEARDDRIWVGTGNGLNIYDRESGSVGPLEPSSAWAAQLQRSAIYDLHEDGAGRLWVGSDSGLYLLPDPADRNSAVRRFSERDGLPNNVIYGIEEDEESFLWLASNKGLTRFRCLDDTIDIRNYDVVDGLQGNEFNVNAHDRCRDGTLLFGGQGGFNMFHPGQLVDNDYRPPLMFTDIKVFNKSVPIKNCNGAGRGFRLDQSISETKRLTLSYRESVVSLEFAALNYVNPSRNRYRYKLEGFDAEWVEAGDRNFATYTNLDAGSYVFRVTACNNDGLWNREGIALQLMITPPPWKSWWAYTLYSGGALSSVLAFTRYKMKEQARALQEQARIDRAKVEERERIRKKNAADFHDEAGNKLTKIMLYTELAKRNAPDKPALNDLLAKIEANSSGLASGMRDFIWVLDPERDTLRDTLERLEEFAASLFHYADTDVSLRYDHREVDGVHLALDVRRQILLIYKEAMHNALKYAGATQAVLMVRVRNGSLSLAFADNGAGFDPAKATGGYGLSNMHARAAQIGAALLIRSAPGEGTQVGLSVALE